MSARLVFLSGGLAGEVVALEGRTRIGRGDSVEFPVPDADARYVSRLHATLSLDGDAWWLADENSTNGTYLNGSRVIRSRLSHGDVVRFGRGGPEARFESGDRPTELALVVEEGATMVAPPEVRRAARADRPLGQGSGQTRYVQALVERAVGEVGGGGRLAARLAGAALVVAVLALGGWGYTSWVANPERRFDAMAEDLTGSVFLIQTGLAVGDDYEPTGWGSGFAASEDGLIITNKHVAMPELYSPTAACKRASIARRGIDPDAIQVVTAWQGGTTFRQPRGFSWGDPGLGWSARDGTLEIAAAAPNNLGPPQRIVCVDLDGQTRFPLEWRRHVQDNADIVVLRVTSRLTPIPLADEEPASGDPILVFGFPAGDMPLETNVAEPMPRTGEVLRVQETIHFDAALLGGNSGGPLLNARGEVVGITTRGHESYLMNNALKIDYARRVLERARARVPR